MKIFYFHQGDSGGPCIEASYRDFLVCVVKTGSECGSGSPGVCERMSPKTDWLTKTSPPYNFYCRYK